MATILESLDTPALLLDADKLERNCRAMRERLAAHGVALRPHVKTAKSVEVARRALDAPAGADHGVDAARGRAVLRARLRRHPLRGGDRAAQGRARSPSSRARGARVTTIVDSVEAARGAGRARRAKAGARIPALIEIDSDGHRAGVGPGDARLLEIGGARWATRWAAS